MSKTLCTVIGVIALIALAGLFYFGSVSDRVVPPGEEAPKDELTLDAKTWTWAGTQMENGRVIKPRQEGVFTVTFGEDRRVRLTTDCNSMGGEYMVSGKKITFDKVMSTMMYCEDSQENEFSVFLQEVPSYSFSEAGELILEMASGTMYLR